MALCGICSIVSKFCLYQEVQDGAQHSLCDLSSAEERLRRSSQSQPPGNVILFLMQPWRGCLSSLPQGHVVGSLSIQTRASSAKLLPNQSAVVCLQVTTIPLNVSISMLFTNHSPQFFIIYKLAEGALCPVVQVITEHNEMYWPQYQPLEYPTSAWASSGLHDPDHNPLSPTV